MTSQELADIPPSLRLTTEEKEVAVAVLVGTDMLTAEKKVEAREVVEKAISKVELGAVFLLILRGKESNDFAGEAIKARVNAKSALSPPDKSLIQSTIQRSPLLDEEVKREASIALKACAAKADTAALVRRKELGLGLGLQPPSYIEERRGEKNLLLCAVRAVYAACCCVCGAAY